MGESLCQCGCGLPAPIATRTDPKSGRVRGQPVRFRVGHYSKTMAHRSSGKKLANKRPLTRELNGNWRGGRSLRTNGYVWVKNESGGYSLEHRLVMAAHLGRPLRRSEVVHHRNGNKTDNRIENLELYESHSAHMRTHMTPSVARELGWKGNQSRKAATLAALKALSAHAGREGGGR